jgi:alkylhydroperoxidase family enzyme
MAAHSVIAEMNNVPESVINAIRDDRPIQDNKLETLRQTAYSLVENRGHLSKGTLGKFASAGYTRKNLLELLPLIAMKTLSNYTNHLANTPLDDAFSQKEWSIPHTARKMSA